MQITVHKCKTLDTIVTTSDTQIHCSQCVKRQFVIINGQAAVRLLRHDGVGVA